MILDTLNTMISIQVFMEGNLEDRSTALPKTERFSDAINEEDDSTDLLVMVLYARKKTHTRYHRSPYFAITLSLLLTQFLYQR